MKKILFALMAAAAILAVGSCLTPEEEETPQPTTIFEIDDLEALPAQAGTFTVGVNANIPFTVEVQEDVNWLRYIETKSGDTPEVISAPATKKSVVFEIDLNEADAMRQARVKFLDEAGEQLKALTIIQKAGGGIEFEVTAPDDVPVDGATITLEVSSNVPYDAKPEVDWITVKNVTMTATELEIASNGAVEPRDGIVNFYRQGTENLIGFVEIHQMEPNVILSTLDGKLGFATIAAAMEAYNALETGPVEMILAKGTHAGNIAIAEDKVPLTINGNDLATLDGSIEVVKTAVTVKNLVVAPSSGSTPKFSTTFNYEHGIFVHTAANGVRLEGVTIDMSGLASDATGIFLLSEGENTTGTHTDIIKNCTVDGGKGGHRLIQAYGAKVNITGTSFRNPYASYAVRFGNKGGKVQLSSNFFDGTAACAVHFNNLEESEITLGNGTKDNNKFIGTFETAYKANTDVTAGSFANTFAPPVSYDGGVLAPIVDPNAPATLERVWGYYNGSKGEWDNQITDCSNWNRNGIISGDYVYVPICGNEDGKYGVAVFDLYTGDYIRTITNGFTKEGRFWTSGIVKMQGDEEDVIYVSNMAMASSNQDLVVYRLIEPDSEGVPTAAEVALRYTVPEGERYGDKMTAYGTNADGLLLFVSFYKSDSDYRHQIEFRLTDGVIGPEVDNKSAALAGQAGSVTGGIYILTAHSTGANSTRQGLYATNFEIRFVVGWWWGDKLDQWYNFLTDKSATWDTDPGSILTNVGNYDPNALDPRLMWVDGVRYLAYTVVELDASANASGYLRVVRCPDNTTVNTDYGLFNAFWAVRDDATAFQRYPIGDPDDFLAVGHEGTNKTGYCDIAYRGDDVYVLSGVTSCGMSVFKVE